eukprot:2219919-Pyramimonas_sp.AAC.1
MGNLFICVYLFVCPNSPSSWRRTDPYPHPRGLDTEARSVRYAIPWACAAQVIQAKPPWHEAGGS